MVVTVSAQKRKAEKKLVGTWILEEVELENIDELAQTFLDMQVGILEQQITQYEEMMKTIEDETEKESYVEQLEILKNQKAEFTLESVKEEFTKEFDNLIGTYKLTFNKDNSYESISEGKTGTWKINKKATELIIIEGERDVIFSITGLTKKKLNLFFVEEQREEVIINLVFIKEKK